MAELSTLGTVLRDTVNPLLSWKPPVKVVATGALTLSGEQTVDGVACVAGDVVLAAGQAAGAARGPYVVAAGSWSRPTWFAVGVNAAGACVKVLAGTHAEEEWLQTASPAIVGTDALTWSSSASAIVSLLDNHETRLDALELTTHGGDRPLWWPPRAKGETPDPADEECDVSVASGLPSGWAIWDLTALVSRSVVGAVDPLATTTTTTSTKRSRCRRTALFTAAQASNKITPMQARAHASGSRSNQALSATLRRTTTLHLWFRRSCQDRLKARCVRAQAEARLARSGQRVTPLFSTSTIGVC